MELKNPVPTFLSNFLSRPASSIPKGAQWAIAFQNLDSNVGGLLNTIEEAYKLEPNAKLWNTTNSAKVLLNKEYQSMRGCLFAQAIDLPGEKIQTNTEGNIKSNAFIRARVGGGREDFGTLKVTFLETNISFVDSLLRGWSLATANFGLIARADDDPLQYRTTLYCYKFGTYSAEFPPFVLQQVIFDGVCCVSVSNEEYNYSPVSGTAKMREAEFLYNSYSIDTATNLPAEFTQNQIPGATDLYSPTIEPTFNPIDRRPPEVNPFGSTNTLQ